MGALRFFYSKKQSVELATSIGKELVDISRGGGEITKDVIHRDHAIRLKYCKKAPLGLK